MRRRDFVILLAGAAATRAASAQQKAMRTVGFLNGTAPGPSAPLVAGFRRGLVDAGYVEGQNVTIEYRWAEGRLDRLPALAEELVRAKPEVIATSGGDGSALAAKA